MLHRAEGACPHHLCSTGRRCAWVDGPPGSLRPTDVLNHRQLDGQGLGEEGAHSEQWTLLLTEMQTRGSWRGMAIASEN